MSNFRVADEAARRFGQRLDPSNDVPAPLRIDLSEVMAFGRACFTAGTCDGISLAIEYQRRPELIEQMRRALERYIERSRT